MDVSVVLGSYNRLEFLKLTVDGIRNELAELKGEGEIIIVDGGSTDGTVPWLTSQKDIISIIQHNRGEWLGKPIKRRSWGYFMNLAFKGAQGKYVCMLSDDCLVIPGAITKAFSYFEERQSSGKNTGGVAFYFRDWPEEKRYHVNRTISETIMLNHGLFLKEALEKVGYINEEDYSFYHADDDLALKLSMAGYPICDAPDSFIEHFMHANIVLRQHVYESERRDYAKLIQNWEKHFVIQDRNNVNSMMFKDYSYNHPYLDKFQLLYQKDLKKQERAKKREQCRVKLKRFMSNIFYLGKYFLESLLFLFTNPKALRRKLLNTYHKHIKK